MCGIFCARLTISTVCSRVMPHLVESLCSFSVPGPCMATPRLGAQRLQIELQADADIGLLAELAAHRVDAVELVHRVDVDAEAVLDGHLQLFVLLVGAVEDERLRIGAGEQRQVHLVDAEAVAAGALLVHDVADGEAVVRLVGEEDLHLGIVAAEGVAELAVGVAELVLRDDEERRAETVGERLHVAAVDPEVAVRRRCR